MKNNKGILLIGTGCIALYLLVVLSRWFGGEPLAEVTGLNRGVVYALGYNIFLLIGAAILGYYFATNDREKSHIDFDRAMQVFQNYVSVNFDVTNPKIVLKLTHTTGVIKCVNEIMARMELSKEDRELAQLIALLHDIGRFEQIKQFDSFERDTMDHATAGVELLFGPRMMIREFVDTDRYDEIIKTAIAKHSDFALKDIYDERIYFHASLIRDADKLDNCRVKLQESIEVMLGETAEMIGSEDISEMVWANCVNRQSVKSEYRQTKMDYWVSYVAYFFDINFPETWDIIIENAYIDKIINRIPYTNAETESRMELLRKMIKQR